MKKLIFVFLLLVIEILKLQQGLYAQINSYIKIDGSYTSIFGTFKGKSSLVGGEMIFLLPELSSGSGWGLTFGLNSPEKIWSVGFKYARSTFDASYMGESLGKANYNLIELFEITRFFPKEWQNSSRERPVIQFYITSGLEMGWITVRDAFYTTLPTVRQGDARFNWAGIPIGTGISINFSEKSSINIGTGYRLAYVMSVSEYSFDSAEFNMEETLGAGGLFFDIGILLQLKFKHKK